MSALVEAHGHSTDHRQEIARSALCGCFYCLSTFPPEAIAEWVDRGSTALCPECGFDAVIGSASGFPITCDFLAAMSCRWCR